MLCVFFSLVLIVLYGCQSSDDESSEEITDIRYETVTLDNDFLESKKFVHDENVIPDKEVAAKVAEQIFNGMREESEKDYIPQLVQHDEENGVWNVVFWEYDDPTDGEVTVGSCCNIAIRETDGKVLKIWYDE